MKLDFVQNRNRLKNILEKHAASQNGTNKANASQIDLMWLTSRDAFLSEYTPLPNHHRFGITNFSGSLGDALFNLHTQKSSLVVDGRYHLQADQEVDPQWVEVIKVDVAPQIEEALFKKIEEVSKSLGRVVTVALVPERFPESLLALISKKLTEQGHVLVYVNEQEVTQALGLPGWSTASPILSLPKAVTGRSCVENLNQLSQALRKEALLHQTNKSSALQLMHVTCATDDAAFLLNARGFHLPYLSSVMAYTFFVTSASEAVASEKASAELIVFLPEASSKAEVKIAESLEPSVKLTIIRNDRDALMKKIKSMEVYQVFYNATTLNGWLSQVVLGELKDQNQKPTARAPDFKWLLETRTVKTHEEKESIRKSFLKSSRAIAKTLRWARAECSAQKKLSEKNVADFLEKSYRDEGAVGLSFHTISGTGAHSAIVHYTANRDDAYLTAGDLFLLDSGAYYPEGFATDCTRGFWVPHQNASQGPEPWQKEIYTQTLKAAISVFLKPVPKKLSGQEVDQLVRSSIKKAGYDYLHGTGHGIGIHVHEEGIRFSTLSTYPQTEHACVSVEPGIYLEGKGGVRVENVVLLNTSKVNSSAYDYENVVWVGYDWNLIDLQLFTQEEKAYLKEYEAQCRALGTQITDCPL